MHNFTPAYATHPMSLQSRKRDTSSQGSSFPDGALQSVFPVDVQQGLLSLLGLHRVYFPCLCFTGSSFHARVQKGLLSLLVLNKGFLSLLVLYKFPILTICHGNQTKWPLVNKHKVGNRQMIITEKYG